MFGGLTGLGGCDHGGGRTPPLGEFEHIVGEADETPFEGDLVEPAHQELAEAAGLLDPPEHRLGQLLAKAIRCPVAAGPDLLAHGRHALATAVAGGRMLGVAQHLNRVDSLLVHAVFLQGQHPSAKQVDTGAAIHGSLEGLQFVDRKRYENTRVPGRAAMRLA